MRVALLPFRLWRACRSQLVSAGLIRLDRLARARHVRPVSSQQVLSLCGAGMLVFQLLVYPRVSKRMGVAMTQRLGCLLSIPVFLAFPLLSRLRDSGAALVVASIIFNFLYNVTATAVSSRNSTKVRGRPFRIYC